MWKARASTTVAHDARGVGLESPGQHQLMLMMLVGSPGKHQLMLMMLGGLGLKARASTAQAHDARAFGV